MVEGFATKVKELLFVLSVKRCEYSNRLSPGSVCEADATHRWNARAFRGLGFRPQAGLGGSPILQQDEAIHIEEWDSRIRSLWPPGSVCEADAIHRWNARAFRGLGFRPQAGLGGSPIFQKPHPSGFGRQPNSL